MAPTPAEKGIAELLRSSPELLFQAALRIHRSPLSGQQQRYTNAEIHQMCDGFAALLLESLDGESQQVRSMLMDTMIPGLLARGESPASILHWNGGFVVLLSCEIVRALPEALRNDATDWLFGFAGSYVADVSRAAGQGASR